MVQQFGNIFEVIGMDGVRKSFDVETLQAEIFRSFLDAGFQEAYLAEDLALAVEHALMESNRPEKIFTETEVNIAVGNMLEDIGYKEVAKIYRVNHPALALTVDSSATSIAQLLKNHLRLDGELTLRLAEKVQDAAKTLNIQAAAPMLYIELAKFYQNMINETPLELHVHIPAPNSDKRKARNRGVTVVTPEMIYNVLSPSTRRWVDLEIIRIREIRSVFPTIRLVFRLTEYVNECRFEIPVTEMLLTPKLYQGGDALHEICNAASGLYLEAASENQEPLPVYLTVPDLSLFAVEQLQAAWPQAKKDCLELLAPLHETLGRDIVKLKVK